MQKIKEIEEGMANVMLHSSYPKTVTEFERLLAIMGNVDGNEVIALVILSCWNVGDVLERGEQ